MRRKKIKKTKGSRRESLQDYNCYFEPESFPPEVFCFVEWCSSVMFKNFKINNLRLKRLQKEFAKFEAENCDLRNELLKSLQKRGVRIAVALQCMQDEMTAQEKRVIEFQKSLFDWSDALEVINDDLRVLRTELAWQNDILIFPKRVVV